MSRSSTLSTTVSSSPSVSCLSNTTRQTYGATPVAPSPIDRSSTKLALTYSYHNDLSIQHSTLDAKAVSDDELRTVLSTKESGKLAMLIAFGKNFWVWEVVALLIGTFALIGLVIILAEYNNKPLVNANFGLTLNAVISALVSLSEFALVYAVAEVISQRKWIAYQLSRPRSLRDFQTFDEASRGPWGALKLLQKFDVGILTLLGAVVMILHLFMGPFAQQVVSYPQRSTIDKSVDPSANVSRAQSYDVDIFPTGELTYLCDRVQYGTLTILGHDNTLSLSIAGGLEQAYRFNATQAHYSCPSGNCTFEPFSSLAVCSTCVPVTGYRHPCAEYNKSSYSDMYLTRCNVTYPGSINTTAALFSTTRLVPYKSSFQAFNENPTSYLNYNWSTFEPLLGDVANPLAIFVVNADGYNMTLPLMKNITKNVPGFQCVLSYCIETYNDVRMTNDRLSSGTIDRWIPPRSSVEIRNGLIIHDQNGKYSNNNTYHVTADSNSQVLMDLMVRTIPTRCTANCSMPTWEEILVESYGQGEAEAPEVLDNLARSMTNSIRNHGGPGGSSVMYGHNQQTLVFVSVEWRWLILPFVVVLLAAVVIVSTIVQSSRHAYRIWKSSSLSLMYHGVDELPADSLETVSAMDKDAEGHIVRLTRNKHGHLRLRRI